MPGQQQQQQLHGGHSIQLYSVLGDRMCEGRGFSQSKLFHLSSLLIKKIGFPFSSSDFFHRLIVSQFLKR
jgi:hypothetical protein